MIRTESLLTDGDGTFAQGLGLVVLALRLAVSAISELNNSPGLSTTRLGW